MAIDTSEYNPAGSFGPVLKLTRAVKTPMSENPDGSGYRTESNKKTVYQMGSHSILVHKVSANGWSITVYDDGSIDMMDKYYTEEKYAHERAREIVEAILEDEH